MSWPAHPRRRWEGAVVVGEAAIVGVATGDDEVPPNPPVTGAVAAGTQPAQYRSALPVIQMPATRLWRVIQPYRHRPMDAWLRD
jgi:hypothetical protein